MVLIYVTKTDFMYHGKNVDRTFKFSSLRNATIALLFPIKFDNFSRFDYGNEICHEKCAAR